MLARRRRPWPVPAAALPMTYTRQPKDHSRQTWAGAARQSRADPPALTLAVTQRDSSVTSPRRTLPPLWRQFSSAWLAVYDAQNRLFCASLAAAALQACPG